MYVVVHHSSETFRKGLFGVLTEWGFTPLEPDTAGGEGGTSRTVHIWHTRDDQAWSALPDLCRKDDSFVVALINDLTEMDYAQALAAGADGVVHVDASPEVIALAVRSAVIGEVVLPREAARLICQRIVSTRHSAPDLNNEEISLIMALSQGKSLVQHARESFLSERTARRILQNVCLRLGVENRAQAITIAIRMGIIGSAD